MTYEVHWHPKTREFLRKCEKDVAERIVEKVESIKENPFPFLNYFPNRKVFKLRVGDWRVLLDIDQRNKIMEILLIDNRGRIYKRF